MRISESRMRQIIREEARKIISEGGSKMTLDALVRSLRKAGEDRLADRYQGSSHYGSNGVLRFRSVGGDKIEMLWSDSLDGSGHGSQYFDDIPVSAARKIGIDTH